jgi:uncharacterized membrane protein
MRQSHPQDLSRILSVSRVLVSLAVGLCAAAIVSALGALALAPLVCWIVATSVVLAWVWHISWPLGSEGTKQLAEAETKASRSTDAAVLIAAVASLGAVAEALVRASGGRGFITVALVILSVVAVVLAWAVVNTVFAFKYARLYYLDEDGGIDFKQDNPPTYSDFAYMAFTVGMSFAVSDTEPDTTAIRRVVLGHALMSFAFATGILAVTINLVANLG